MTTLSERLRVACILIAGLGAGKLWCLRWFVSFGVAFGLHLRLSLCFNISCFFKVFRFQNVPVLNMQTFQLFHDVVLADETSCMSIFKAFEFSNNA